MLTDAELLDCARRANPKLTLADSALTTPIAELGLDSLDRFNLYLFLQEKTGIEVPDDAVADLDTLASIGAYIRARES